MNKQVKKVYNESLLSAMNQGLTKAEAQDILCNKCGNFGFECKCAWGPSILDTHEREDVIMM